MPRLGTMLDSTMGVHQVHQSLKMVGVQLWDEATIDQLSTWSGPRKDLFVVAFASSMSLTSLSKDVGRLPGGYADALVVPARDVGLYGRASQCYKLGLAKSLGLAGVDLQDLQSLPVASISSDVAAVFVENKQILEGEAVFAALCEQSDVAAVVTGVPLPLNLSLSMATWSNDYHRIRRQGRSPQIAAILFEARRGQASLQATLDSLKYMAAQQAKSSRRLSTLLLPQRTPVALRHDEDDGGSPILTNCSRLPGPEEACDATARAPFPVGFTLGSLAKMKSAGSIHTIRQDPDNQDDCEGIPARCAFTLAVLRPPGSRSFCATTNGKECERGPISRVQSELARFDRLRREITSAFDDQERAYSVLGGSQTNIAPAKWGENLRYALFDYVREVLLPVVSNVAFGGAPVEVKSTGPARRHGSLRASLERSFLFHFDGLPDSDISEVKALLYLSHVTEQDGCFITLLHRDTKQPYEVKNFKYPRNWGGPPRIWRPWIAQLQEEGYRQQCITGPPGTLVIFDTNTIHRGSVPLPGRVRDFILFQVRPQTAPINFTHPMAIFGKVSSDKKAAGNRDRTTQYRMMQQVKQST